MPERLFLEDNGSKFAKDWFRLNGYKVMTE